MEMRQALIALLGETEIIIVLAACNEKNNERFHLDGITYFDGNNCVAYGCGGG